MNRWMRLLAASAVVAGVAACTAVPVASPPAPAFPKGGDVKSLLWIGNSYYYYNNSMHDHVRFLLNAAKVTGFRQNSITISAAGIDWHDLEPHLRPGSGVGRYSFSPANEVVFNKFDRPYDAVMIMDCSQCPIHPTLKPVFHEYAKKHSDTVRKYGGQPAFFASWAYEDKPEMTQQLLDEYVQAGKANNALVVPAASPLKTKPVRPWRPRRRRTSGRSGSRAGRCSSRRSRSSGGCHRAGRPDTAHTPANRPCPACPENRRVWPARPAARCFWACTSPAGPSGPDGACGSG